jgi:hypothetical protein
MRLKGSTVVRIKITFVCVRRPCSFVVGYGHFRAPAQLLASSECYQLTKAADSLKPLLITRIHGDISHSTLSTSIHCTSTCFDLRNLSSG